MAATTSSLLQLKYDVKILTATTHKHGWNKSDWPEDLAKVTTLVEIDTELKAIPALANLFGSGSYNVDRFYSKDLEWALIQLLEEFVAPKSVKKTS